MRGEMCKLSRTRKKNFIKTTYDISLDSQISLLPLGFSLQLQKLINYYLTAGAGVKGESIEEIWLMAQHEFLYFRFLGPSG